MIDWKTSEYGLKMKFFTLLSKSKSHSMKISLVLKKQLRIDFTQTASQKSIVKKPPEPQKKKSWLP